jgi:hypothetical protein
MARRENVFANFELFLYFSLLEVENLEECATPLLHRYVLMH